MNVFNIKFNEEHAIKCLKKIQFLRKFNFPDFLNRKCSSNMVLLENIIISVMSADKTTLQSVSLPSSLAPCSVVANFSIYYGKIIKHLNLTFLFHLCNNFHHAFPKEPVCMLHKSFFHYKSFFHHKSIMKIHFHDGLVHRHVMIPCELYTSWLYHVMPVFLFHTSL